ncbi:hypothetical protein COB21_04555, partial [Candidatus Aerophobetes bacterium]
ILLPNGDYYSIKPLSTDQGFVEGSIGFCRSIHEETQELGSLPTTVIQLYHLKIGPIMEVFRQARERINDQEITWAASVSYKADITEKAHNTVNSQSFVYTLLKAGGIENKEFLYGSHSSRTGPKDREFYDLTRCNIDSYWGQYARIPVHINPRDLLLWVTSAAEAYAEDKQATCEVMQSRLVEQISVKEETDTETEESPTHGAAVEPKSTVAGQIAGTTIGLLALAAGGIAFFFQKEQRKK